MAISSAVQARASDDYPHGGNGAALKRSHNVEPSEIIDLSLSLNPFAPAVAEIAANHSERLSHYPDPRAATSMLATELGVTEHRLVLTNGASEAIALVAQQLRSGTIGEPEFSLYRRHLDRVADVAADPTRRWRSNPNNPLGTLAASGDRSLVWDEAFYQMATGRWSRGDDASWRIGSLTKLWSCPGLRLGYAIAPTEAAAKSLAARQPRWAVNGLALAVVPELLQLTDLALWASQIAELRTNFAKGLKSLGLQVTPSTANWVLVTCNFALDDALAPAGIAVRDCSNFGLPNVWRLALPKPKQVDRVLSTMERYLVL